MNGVALAAFLATTLTGGAEEAQQERRVPELDGGVGWFNTDKPVRLEDLKGKVVLLDFWTYC